MREEMIRDRIVVGVSDEEAEGISHRCREFGFS